MIKHYINVNEKDSTYFIADSNYSYHIGFVYDNEHEDKYKDANFGYIITNKKRFGLSYYELVGHLQNTATACNNYADDLYDNSTYYLSGLYNMLVDTNNKLNDLYIKHNSTPYYTNELFCANSNDRAFLKEIRANKSVLKTNYINSVTIKLRNDILDNDNNKAEVYMIICDRKDPEDNTTAKYLLKCPRSTNSIVQFEHPGEYVTFYFDHVMIKDDDCENGRYAFKLIYISENETSVRIVNNNCHVKNTGSISQNIICVDQYSNEQKFWQAAFGVNVEHMFNNDNNIELFNNYISIDWNSNPLYLRNFTTSGNYIIKGTRINSDDDFPLTNTGFNFMANLQVLSSSFKTNTNITTYSITQILNLNTNGTEHYSYIYMRNGWTGTSISDLKNNTNGASWSPWKQILTAQ